MTAWQVEPAGTSGSAPSQWLEPGAITVAPLASVKSVRAKIAVTVISVSRIAWGQLSSSRCSICGALAGADRDQLGGVEPVVVLTEVAVAHRGVPRVAQQLAPRGRPRSQPGDPLGLAAVEVGPEPLGRAPGAVALDERGDLCGEPSEEIGRRGSPRPRARRLARRRPRRLPSRGRRRRSAGARA